MGGESKSTTTQNSTQNPWGAAIPALNGILGQIGSNLNNTGVTSNENSALNTLISNGQAATQFAPMLSDFAKALFAGGGANDQAGAVKQNFEDYSKAVSPLATNLDYDPRNTQGFGDVLSSTIADIMNNTNGAFAAGGRDFSGANSMALGRGITQGVAPIIQSQFNANRTAQQDAAAKLFGAGVTNNGILSGMQQQFIENQGKGGAAAGAATDAANSGANATLAAEAARRGIPVQALGLLAQIGIPIAGLGGTSSGTSNTTKQEAAVDTIGKWVNIGGKVASFI